MLRKARDKKKKFEQNVTYVDSKTNSPDLEVISRSPTPVKSEVISKFEPAVSQPEQTYNNRKMDLPETAARQQENKLESVPVHKVDTDLGHNRIQKSKSSHMSTLPHLPLPDIDLDVEHSPAR